MPNPVVHFEVQSSEPEKSQKFFADLFDWHLDANNPMSYGLVDTHARGINGGIGDSEDGQTRVLFYIEVDDLQAHLDKVETLGGKTLVPPTEIPDMVTFALFSDPAGAVVGMVKSEQQ